MWHQYEKKEVNNIKTGFWVVGLNDEPVDTLKSFMYLTDDRLSMPKLSLCNYNGQKLPRKPGVNATDMHV